MMISFFTLDLKKVRLEPELEPAVMLILMFLQEGTRKRLNILLFFILIFQELTILKEVSHIHSA